MCFVSLVSSGLQTQNQPFGQLQNWPPQQVIDLSEVIRRLDRIDQVLGLKDCKDEAKEKFLKELNDLVERYLGPGFILPILPASPDIVPMTQTVPNQAYIHPDHLRIK